MYTSKAGKALKNGDNVPTLLSGMPKKRGPKPGSQSTMGNLVDAHPKRAQIVEDLLDGVSLVTISAGLYPPISTAVLSRYRRNLVKRAVAPLRRGANKENKEIASVVDQQTPEGRAAYREKMREELEETARRIEERRERWINDAEHSAVYFRGAKVGEEMNHSALSSHDGNTIRSLEFRAKVAGLFNEGDANIIGVNVQLNINGTASSNGRIASDLGIDPDEVKTLDISATRR